MTNPNTKALSDAGVSIWLDDLSRDLLETGKISDLIEERNVVGLTSNPSIFQAAMSKGDRYNDDLAKLTKDGKYGLAFSAIPSEEGTWQFLPFFWSNGAELSQLDSAKATQALQFVTDLVNSGSAS